MAVTGLEIRSRDPFEAGAEFGEGGPYERIDGLLKFGVDPEHDANQAIVDLGLAARDVDGRVSFEADFTLLRPIQPDRGNRDLLLYVPNRGRRATLPFSGLPYPTTITDRIDPGDGFLLRHGWTVLFCGWQWDVVRRPGFLGLEAPQALECGRPIQGWVRTQFQPGERHRYQHLAHWPSHPAPGDQFTVHRPYPAANVDDPEAVLTVREWHGAPRSTIPRHQWRFARDQDGRTIEDDSCVWLESGFEPGKMYEVVYRTRICPVVGTGLLAVRDAASFFRYEDAAAGNPCAGEINHTIGHGRSQCGRFLRDYLYFGLNLDEAGRPAFDAVMPHVAGARRGEFNFRYAQPSVQHVPDLGHLMPFSYQEQTDPVTGESDGLLKRQRALGGVPKVVDTNTSSEYWRSDCSLIHTDISGEHDLDPPEGVRIYHFAGTQHGAGRLPLRKNTTYGAHAANTLNVVDYTPLERAILVNVEQWVTNGVEPPPSVFPRLAHGTAVSRASVLERFRQIPGVAMLDEERLPTLRRIELASDAATRRGPAPPAVGEPFPSYASEVDSDLNETAGIRLPDLTVPLASHTGWVARDPKSGAAEEILDMHGATHPFPQTTEEGKRIGDPRASIEERYRDRDQYLRRVRAEAEQLVAQSFLLAEDVDLVLNNAGARYDAIARPRVLSS